MVSGCCLQTKMLHKSDLKTNLNSCGQHPVVNQGLRQTSPVAFISITEPSKCASTGQGPVPSSSFGKALLLGQIGELDSGQWALLVKPSPRTAKCSNFQINKTSVSSAYSNWSLDGQGFEKTFSKKLVFILSGRVEKRSSFGG